MSVSQHSSSCYMLIIVISDVTPLCCCHSLVGLLAWYVNTALYLTQWLSLVSTGKARNIQQVSFCLAHLTSTSFNIQSKGRLKNCTLLCFNFMKNGARMKRERSQNNEIKYPIVSLCLPSLRNPKRRLAKGQSFCLKALKILRLTLIYGVS